MAFQARRSARNQSRQSGVALHDLSAGLGREKAKDKKERKCRRGAYRCVQRTRIQLEGANPRARYATNGGFLEEHGATGSGVFGLRKR
jgi:hypothetical protein